MLVSLWTVYESQQKLIVVWPASVLLRLTKPSNNPEQQQSKSATALSAVIELNCDSASCLVSNPASIRLWSIFERRNRCYTYIHCWLMVTCNHHKYLRVEIQTAMLSSVHHSILGESNPSTSGHVGSSTMWVAHTCALVQSVSWASTTGLFA